MLTKGQRSQNTNLAAGVMSLDIRRGITLGIAIILRFLQRRFKGQTRTDHTSQNVVGGTIENTGNLQDFIGDQTLGQGTNDGDTSTHAGLKQVTHLMLLGKLDQLISMLRHQFFVGGNYALARLQGTNGVVQCGSHTTDGLHYNIHFGIVLNCGKIIDKFIRKGTLAKITNQDVLQANSLAEFLGNTLLMSGQNLSYAGTNRTESQNCCLNHRLIHSKPESLRSVFSRPESRSEAHPSRHLRHAGTPPR